MIKEAPADSVYEKLGGAIGTKGLGGTLTRISIVGKLKLSSPNLPPDTLLIVDWIRPLVVAADYNGFHV
jgi:hypothetical protein